MEKISISSVLPREAAYTMVRRKKINDLLRVKCKQHKFTFIENDNIMLARHIRRDGVHLNNAGTVKLSNNFLNVLNKPYVNARREDCFASSITSSRTYPVGGN